MPETVSLKEVLRKAIEEDDKRDKTPATAVELMELERDERQRVLKESADLVSEEMSFVEQAGQLIPLEGK